MKNFKNKNYKHGGFGGNRRGGNSYGKSHGGDRSIDREQRMFKAVCSDCRKTCEVPFKPSSDKPVFCRDCFSAKRDRETREYKAGLLHGEVKKFGQNTPTSYPVSTQETVVTAHLGETTKKQLAEMNSRIDKLTALVEKMIEEKNVTKVVKTVAPASKVTVKKVVAKVAKKMVVKKVVTKAVKKVAAKKVVVKKVAPKVVAKKTVAKKVAQAKKVVAKKK